MAQKILQKIGKSFSIILFCLIFFYLSYHAFSGERGVAALVKLSNEQSKLLTELEQARADRIKFEHKVNLIRSESLDLDLLEEEAKKLGMVHKKEKVILNNKTKNIE